MCTKIDGTRNHDIKGDDPGTERQIIHFFLICGSQLLTVIYVYLGGSKCGLRLGNQKLGAGERGKRCYGVCGGIREE